MKIPFWLFGALLFSYIWCGLADAKPREFWRDAYVYSEPWEPLTLFAERARKFPSQRIHVTWGLAGPHAGDGGVAIYDPKRQIVWVDYSSYWWSENAESTLQDQHRSQQRWKISGVTPARIRRLIRKYKTKDDNEQREVAYLPRLSEVGCRCRVLLKSEESWREKLVTNAKGGVFVKIPGSTRKSVRRR